MATQTDSTVAVKEAVKEKTISHSQPSRFLEMAEDL